MCIAFYCVVCEYNASTTHERETQMVSKQGLTKSTIFGVPSLQTAGRIDDVDKVSAFEAAHYRCQSRMRELSEQFEAKASEIRAAFVAEASEIIGQEEAE
jgi:hypothetical protein